MSRVWSEWRQALGALISHARFTRPVSPDKLIPALEKFPVARADSGLVVFMGNDGCGKTGAGKTGAEIIGKGMTGMRKFLMISAAALLAAGAAAPAAADEIQVGFHLGWNKTPASDVTFTGPGGTDFTVESVPWQGLSLPGDDGAPYYGGRAIYWFNDDAGWGVMLDYTHAKIRAQADATVTLTGDTGASMVAPGDYTVSALYDRLEFTDGINFVTLSALYRFPRSGRLQPYLGAGAGFSVPHVEVTGAALSDLPQTFEYTNGGVTVQGLAGLDLRLTELFSLYGEYRMNYTPVSVPLSDPAYELETDLFTNQFLFGVALHF